MKMRGTNKILVEEVIEKLRRIDIDGETMQYIIEKLGMEDQILRQLTLSNLQSDAYDLFPDRSGIGDKELKSLLWRFFKRIIKNLNNEKRTNKRAVNTKDSTNN